MNSLFSWSVILRSWGRRIEVERPGGTSERIEGDPFDVLRSLLAEHEGREGAAVGYLGYGLKQHVEKLPETVVDDPQFRDRLPLYPHEEHGADMLPFPVKFLDEELPAPSKAPTVGEHNDQVLSEILGYDGDRIAELKDVGALG